MYRFVNDLDLNPRANFKHFHSISSKIEEDRVTGIPSHSFNFQADRTIPLRVMCPERQTHKQTYKQDNQRLQTLDPLFWSQYRLNTFLMQHPINGLVNLFFLLSTKNKNRRFRKFDVYDVNVTSLYIFTPKISYIWNHDLKIFPTIYYVTQYAKICKWPSPWPRVNCDHFHWIPFQIGEDWATEIQFIPLIFRPIRQFLSELHAQTDKQTNKQTDRPKWNTLALYRGEDNKELFKWP